MNKNTAINFMLKTWREYIKQMTPEKAGTRNGMEYLLKAMDKAGMLSFPVEKKDAE